MNLIEFKNKPDTSTPINSNNLNHNFNEIKNMIKTEKTYGDEYTYSCDYINAINKICYGGLRQNKSHNLTLATWTPQTVPMDEDFNWNGGTKLINSGDGKSITIGAGVSKIKVRGMVTIQSPNKDSIFEVHLCKNDVIISGASYYGTVIQNQNTTSFIIQETLLDVNEGDKITLIMTAGTDLEINTYATSYKAVTNFFIEVIE